MKDIVFQRIMKPITKNLIQQCVERFRSDYDYVSFKTLDHLQTMIFAHLHEIKSLRILEVAINSQKLGITSRITRSTLSDANNKREADCFFWILEQVMHFIPRKMRNDVKKVVRVLDSSPIQLKGRGYNEWAKEFATNRCQGLKLHTEYDLQTKSPAKIEISYPNFNDSSMGQQWPITADTVYVFDKGYCDFNWWWGIHQKRAYFITRLKKNAAIIQQSQHETTSNIILEDITFKFKNQSPRGGKKNLYTASLRQIKVAREGKAPLVLVTNLHDHPAEIIADLYKARWDIELFFKWIKQNLKLKKFLGKSANAVKIQLATAIIAYLLVKIFKDATQDNRTLQIVLTWVKYNLQTNKSFCNKDSPPINRRAVHL